MVEGGECIFSWDHAFIARAHCIAHPPDEASRRIRGILAKGSPQGATEIVEGPQELISHANKGSDGRHGLAFLRGGMTARAPPCLSGSGPAGRAAPGRHRGVGDEALTRIQKKTLERAVRWD